MLKKIGILLYLISCLRLAYGENSSPRLLIFAEGNNDILTLEITQQLKELKKDDGSGQALFAEVGSLNEMITKRETGRKLRNETIQVSSAAFVYSSIRDSLQQRYADILIHFDLLLLVRSKLIHDLVEYQFFVWDVNNEKPISTSSSEAEIFNELLLVSPRSNNFILDVRDGDYRTKLNEEIRSCFPEANFEPLAEISTNDRIIEDRIDWFVGIGDTVVLQAGYSSDQDTPTENLRYKWRQLNPDATFTIPDSIKAFGDLRKGVLNKVDFLLFFKQTGTYLFGLTVFDGVEYSQEDTVRIEVIPKPVIAFPEGTKKVIGVSTIRNPWLLHAQDLQIQVNDPFELNPDSASLRISVNDYSHDYEPGAMYRSYRFYYLIYAYNPMLSFLPSPQKERFAVNRTDIPWRLPVGNLDKDQSMEITLNDRGVLSNTLEIPLAVHRRVGFAQFGISARNQIFEIQVDDSTRTPLAENEYGSVKLDFEYFPRIHMIMRANLPVTAITLKDAFATYNVQIGHKYDIFSRPVGKYYFRMGLMGFMQTLPNVIADTWSSRELKKLNSFAWGTEISLSHYKWPFELYVGGDFPVNKQLNQFDGMPTTASLSSFSRSFYGGFTFNVYPIDSNLALRMSKKRGKPRSF